ncbi:unnamed protein product, partial [Brassica rapa subsp. trilocularis]
DILWFRSLTNICCSIVSLFLSNGDFEGDKTKTLPWSCSAIIFADLKSRLPNSAVELPPRMFTLGEEPDAIRSISYHSDDTKLFKALCDCLTADEYEDLKASKLVVFIKFKELDFGWTSRLVHFLLCFQLDIKKKFELWSLVVSQPVRFSLIEFEHLTGLNCDYIKDLENPRCEVTTEMAAFWEKMRVDLDTGPSIEQITEAFYNCDEWSRDDRMRLGYLAIHAGYIEGKKFSSATSASLARLVMDLEKLENYPWGRVAFKVLMDSLKAKDLTQTGYTVDGFIQVLQVWAYYAMPELGANYGSPIPNKPSPLLLAYKGGKRQRKCFKAAINKQLKLLGYRMVAVEKKVGITNKGGSSDDRQLTTTSNPPKPVDEPGLSESVNGAKAGQKEAKEPSLTTEPSSSRELCLVRPADDLPSDDPSVLILDKQVSTASDLLVEEARRQTKKETALVNLRKKSVRERKLAPTQQTPFKGNSTAKQIIPNKQVGGGYDPFAPYDKMKSKELTAWVQKDPASYPDFKSDAPDANGLGRRLPGGAWNYHPGVIPSFCKFKKVWGVDVDDIYAPVNFKNRHWIAIWISIPKRHIVVWDSIVSHISPEELDEVMEPFVTMVPYLLVECALSDEQKVQYTLEPYTYARQTVGVPQCRAGDCGPFTLKYIECHALGMEFPTAFDKKNGKTIREKMALDIFRELPMCHEWENQDNDENLATYD